MSSCSFLGDIEKKHNLEVSPLCDRDKNTMGDIQIGNATSPSSLPLATIDILLLVCSTLFLPLSVSLLVSVSLYPSPTRLHDLRGGASVLGVGPLLGHAALPDHAGAPGAEQGQLGQSPAGAAADLWP